MPPHQAPDRSLFTPRLVRLGLKAANSQAVISTLAEMLVAESKVRESFLEAVLAREAEFPTGLPTPGAAIAIPHTDARHCMEPAVAVAILQEPVEFTEMGSSDSTLEVRIVFVLSITNPQDHVEWLSRLASAFGSPQLAHMLLDAKDASEVCQLLYSAVGA